MANQWLDQPETQYTINDTLLCLQKEAQHNCPLRGSTQQQNEVDAGTHSQTLGKAQEVLGKSEGVDKRSVRGKMSSRGPTESSNLDP